MDSVVVLVSFRGWGVRPRQELTAVVRRHMLMCSGGSAIMWGSIMLNGALQPYQRSSICYSVQYWSHIAVAI